MKFIVSVCLGLMLSLTALAQAPDSTRVGMNGKPTHYLPGFSFTSPRGQATLVRWIGALRGPWRWQVKYVQGGKTYIDWIDDDTIDSLTNKSSMILLEYKDDLASYWQKAATYGGSLEEMIL